MTNHSQLWVKSILKPSYSMINDCLLLIGLVPMYKIHDQYGIPLQVMVSEGLPLAAIINLQSL